MAYTGSGIGPDDAKETAIHFFAHVQNKPNYDLSFPAGAEMDTGHKVDQAALHG